MTGKMVEAVDSLLNKMEFGSEGTRAACEQRCASVHGKHMQHDMQW